MQGPCVFKYSKNEECCIENEKLCIENDEFCRRAAQIQAAAAGAEQKKVNNAGE